MGLSELLVIAAYHPDGGGQEKNMEIMLSATRALLEGTLARAVQGSYN